MEQQAKHREPILTIDVLELTHQSSTIRLVRPGHPDRIVEGSSGYGNLAEYYRLYREELESFKLQLRSDSLDQDLGTLTEAFRVLFGTGQVLFARLFGDSTAEILRYLQDHIIALAGCRQPIHSYAGLIEVRTKNIKDIIPIESLVIIGSKPEVRSLSDMIRAASGILGFSFL